MKNFYEIYQKYMSMSKETLAELLAAKEMNEIENNDVEILQQYLPDDMLRGMHRCKSFEDCINPYKDCIDCPFHLTNGWSTSNNFSTKSDNDFINKIKKMTDD